MTLLTLHAEFTLPLAHAPDAQFVLTSDATIRWIGEPVAKVITGDLALRPRVRILADEQLTGAALDGVQTRLDLWLRTYVERLLGPTGDELSCERCFDLIDVGYKWLLGWALRHRLIVLMIAVSTFFGSIKLAGTVGGEFVAPEDRGQFKLTPATPWLDSSTSAALIRRSNLSSGPMAAPA